MLSIDLLILRDVIQPQIRPVRFLLRWLGSHQDLPYTLIISIVETLNNTHSRGTLILDKSLFFQQPTLRYHVVVVVLFFLCKMHVRKTQQKLDKNP